MNERKYAFSWSLLGDLQLGRPNLGPTTRLEVYRLMQYCFRDVLERRLGAGETDRIFYEAGHLAGCQFHKNLMPATSDLNEYLRALQALLRELSMGILRVEEADPETCRFVLTVSEDLDCSGLPELEHEICTYDEGFIAGLLESFSGRKFSVKEVDCWCTGDRTCRFRAEAEGEA